jgi:hypothetical protein
MAMMLIMQKTNAGQPASKRKPSRKQVAAAVAVLTVADKVVLVVALVPVVLAANAVAHRVVQVVLAVALVADAVNVQMCKSENVQMTTAVVAR